MAEHLHDSVLQTLTLIQKRTASAPDVDARAISALARRQERELRRWLYGHGDDPDGSSFRATMEAVVADVEDMHNVTVEAVLVGDAPLDPALDAVTGAVREALVNAAKFSGRADISLFVELGESAVSAFVRDRGLGFDPSSVPADRHGIRDSITGRVQRQGGMAAVRSTPGGGTEVEVRVPRRQAHPDAQPDAEPGVPADEVPR
jgi:signal transduction histidine kinase